MFDKFLPYGMTRGMLRAGAVMTGILFVLSYAVDVSLGRFGVSPAATIWNDAAIALIAAALLIFYLFSNQTEQIFLRARAHEPDGGTEPPFAPRPGRDAQRRRSGGPRGAAANDGPGHRAGRPRVN